MFKFYMGLPHVVVKMEEALKPQVDQSPQPEGLAI